MSKPRFGKYPKYEGAGNSFLLIDDRTLAFDSTAIPSICSDVDGALLLQPSKIADFRMRIFNRDGSEADGCGNGLRCLALFIKDLGLPEKPYRIEMGKRIVGVRYVGDRIATELGAPQNLILNRNLGPWTVHTVDTGVPHAVIFVPDVSKIDLASDAPFIRRHPALGPQGANVNFAAIEKTRIRVRTFERGVEGETLACGTGAAAVAVVAAALFPVSSPVLISFLGGEIEAALMPLSLIGPVRRVSLNSPFR